jgi:hypothetical protein
MFLAGSLSRAIGEVMPTYRVAQASIMSGLSHAMTGNS